MSEVNTVRASATSKLGGSTPGEKGDWERRSLRPQRGRDAAQTLEKEGEAERPVVERDQDESVISGANGKEMFPNRWSPCHMLLGLQPK